MSNFNPDTLPLELKNQYDLFMKKINKNGRINLGLKWPNGKGDYSNLSQCWTHTASKSSNGYGQIDINKVHWNLHKFSYWIHNGQPVMSDRKYHVGHNCDNEDCANPEHLEYDTAEKNVRDGATRCKNILPAKIPVRTSIACNACRADTHHACVGYPCSQCVKNKIMCVKEDAVVQPQAFKKGDNAGENNPKCKLSSAKIFEIRTRYMKGVAYGGMKKWPEEYGISYTTIQAIIGRKNYRSEPEAIPEGWT